MTIPRTDKLLLNSRILSLQKDFGDEYGIATDFFLVALNQAQLKIQTFLVTQMSEPFSDYYEVACDGSESYAQPTNIFAHNMIYDVWYSSDGIYWSEQPLQRKYDRGNTYVGSTGEPEEFMIDGGRVYLDTRPSTGSIRMRFESRINRLDIRRGTVENKNITGGELLTITLEDDSNLDNDAIGAAEYVCVVDRYGTILARNIPVASYDSSSLVITVESGFELDADETVDVGAYVVVGADTSTHSTLPDIAEAYYLDYCENAVHELVSSTDADKSNPKLKEYLAQIGELYQQMPSGRMAIPERRGDW